MADDLHGYPTLPRTTGVTCQGMNLAHPSSRSLKDSERLSLLRGRAVVALVTFDSVRKDYVGCYREGATGKTTTPFLDALASRGMVYSSAFSHGGGTPEAFPSIMASVLPPYSLGERHVKGKRTIATILKESEFETGGFHSNPFLSSAHGYGEGFDEFFEGESRAPGLVPPPLRRAYDGARVLLNRAPITDGLEVTSRAISWLKGTRGPAFLWLHFMDTHFPYLPTSNEIGLGASIRSRATWASLMSRRIQYRIGEVSQSTRREVLRSYEACVSRVDQCISRLFSESRRLFDSQLFILTSDHGESFWEDGRFGHIGLHDRILNVPLILYSNTLNPCVVKGTVAHSDILPTICSFTGNPVPQGIIGSTLPVRQEDQRGQERLVVCTSIDPPLNRRLVGVRGQRFKYLRELNLKAEIQVSERLLSLQDSAEVNAGPEHGLEMERLRRYLLASYSHASPGAGFLVNDESEITARLKSLGYE